MSLTLPDLDDRTYADLLDEARALIPGLYPEWTNHNPTDPGITLIELFAWLTEMLIFRINRLPQENVRTFLRLLNGPDWTPGPDLDEDIRLSVADLRKRHRAVTADDYELLAREAAPGVARTRCVPLRDLSAASEEEREVPRAGQVSVIVVPDPEQPEALAPTSQPGAPQPSESLLTAVREYLEPRRLLTVRQAVAAPVYAPVQAEIVVARRPDTSEAALRDRIEEELLKFLDPLVGGPNGPGSGDGAGWPFGRDIYASELYQLLERIPGIDFVPSVDLSSECPPGASRCVAAAGLWHDNGDFIGLGLRAHHLPWAQLGPASVFVGESSSFVPVEVQVTATAEGDTVAAEVRRKVKQTVRSLFHPLREGPDGQADWQLTELAVEGKVLGLPEILAVTKVRIVADPRWLFQEGDDKGLRLKAGELADVEVVLDGI